MEERKNILGKGGVLRKLEFESNFFWVNSVLPNRSWPKLREDVGAAGEA